MDSSALDSFLDKWRTRWPEWDVAEVFVAAERRPRTLAWFALLQEFEDAMNIVGETLPADAKLAWWGEELRSWSQQRSRHPLGRVLEPIRADWSALADGLPLLMQARDPAASAAQARLQLMPYARAVAQVEAAVLGRAGDAEAIAVQTLAQRLMETQGAGVPLDQTGDDAQARQVAWARSLLNVWPGSRTGAAERRLWASFARARLARFIQAGAAAPLPSRIKLLLSAWWQARGG